MMPWVRASMTLGRRDSSCFCAVDWIDMSVLLRVWMRIGRGGWTVLMGQPASSLKLGYLRVAVMRMYSCLMRVWLAGSGAAFSEDQRCSRSAKRAFWPGSSSLLNATLVGPNQVRKKSTQPAGLVGMSKSIGMGLVSMLVKKGERRSRTVASSPQRMGGLTPGGGGTCELPTLNMRATKAPGPQLPMASRPPGLRTRAHSEATSSGRGANMAPNMVVTASKVASP